MDIELGGCRTRVYTGGRAFEARRPVVVLIHGGAHDHSVWTLQARHLAHHGHAVLAPDLPGHGRSSGPPLASVAALADWIMALLDALGVERAALAGHSMGSLVALDCAGRHPARITRLALLGAAFPMRVSAQLLDAARADEARARAMINVWSHAALAHDPSNPGPGGWPPGANLRLLERQAPGVLHTDFLACDHYADGLERAAAVRCPVLMILAGRDQMTPPRAAAALADTLAAAAPSLRSITMPDSGHALMSEAPDAVLDALRDFLSEPRNPS